MKPTSDRELDDALLQIRDATPPSQNAFRNNLRHRLLQAEPEAQSAARARARAPAVSPATWLERLAYRRGSRPVVFPLATAAVVALVGWFGVNSTDYLRLVAPSEPLPLEGLTNAAESNRGSSSPHREAANSRSDPANNPATVFSKVAQRTAGPLEPESLRKSTDGPTAARSADTPANETPANETLAAETLAADQRGAVGSTVKTNVRGRRTLTAIASDRSTSPASSEPRAAPKRFPDIAAQPARALRDATQLAGHRVRLRAPDRQFTAQDALGKASRTRGARPADTSEATGDSFSPRLGDPSALSGLQPARADLRRPPPNRAQPPGILARRPQRRPPPAHLRPSDLSQRERPPPRRRAKAPPRRPPPVKPPPRPTRR